MDGLDRQNRGCWAHYPPDPPAPDVILSPPGRAGRWYGPNHRRYRIHISNVSGRWFLSRPPCPIPFVQRRRAGSIPPCSEAWARCPLPLRRCQRCLIVSKVSYCVKGVLLYFQHGSWEPRPLDFYLDIEGVQVGIGPFEGNLEDLVELVKGGDEGRESCRVMIGSRDCVMATLMR